MSYITSAGALMLSQIPENNSVTAPQPAMIISSGDQSNRPCRKSMTGTDQRSEQIPDAPKTTPSTAAQLLNDQPSGDQEKSALKKSITGSPPL